jgi:hypothetical protein
MNGFQLSKIIFFRSYNIYIPNYNDKNLTTMKIL